MWPCLACPTATEEILVCPSLHSSHHTQRSCTGLQQQTDCQEPLPRSVSLLWPERKKIPLETMGRQEAVRNCHSSQRRIFWPVERHWLYLHNTVLLTPGQKAVHVVV